MAEDFAQKTVADVMGQIVWLMTQSKFHRSLFISDLEWAIMPAILVQQLKFHYHEGQPKAAVFWALVSEEVKERIDSSAQPRLRLHDWRSDDIPVVVDAIAPFGDRERLMDEFLKELSTSLSEESTR